MQTDVDVLIALNCDSSATGRADPSWSNSMFTGNAYKGGVVTDSRPLPVAVIPLGDTPPRSTNWSPGRSTA